MRSLIKNETNMPILRMTIYTYYYLYLYVYIIFAALLIMILMRMLNMIIYSYNIINIF
jgi:hypothetical protein